MTEEFAFLSARTLDDWEEWAERNVSVTEEGITLAKTPTLSPAQLGFAATDVDLSPNGNLGVLTDDGEVRVYVRDDGALRQLSLAGSERAALAAPAGIATTATQVYVVDEAGRVAVFSRRLRRLEWFTDTDTDPVALVGSQRRAYLLDADGSVLVLRADAATGGSVGEYVPRGAGVETVASGFTAPVDLSVGPADTVYVLDERVDGYVLSRVASDAGSFGGPTRVQLTFPPGFAPHALAAQTNDVFVCYGIESDGTPSIRRFDTETDTVERLSTLDQSWTGLVSGTVGDAGDEQTLFIQSGTDGRVWSLTEEADNQKDPENTRYEGRIVGRFDAGRRDVQWHRATLDIDQQEQDTRVDVTYYTTNGDQDGIDDLSALSDLGDTEQRELEAAGIEGLWDLLEHDVSTVAGVLPVTPEQKIRGWIDEAEETVMAAFDERTDVREAHDPEDMLLEEATGRYLNVEIRLVGSRAASPRLRSLTAYCPRKSYIRYLPEIYRQQSGSSAFLPHFLSLFESVFVDIEQTFGDHTQFLDPETIPADYLSWLNDWLAVDMGEAWPESARRELLSRAPELYRRRGTVGGISATIELYLDHVTLPSRSWENALVRIERSLESLVEAGYLDAHEAAAQIEAYRERASSNPAEAVYFAEHDALSVIDDPERRETYSQLVGHPRRFQLLLQPSLPSSCVSAIRAIVDSEMPVYTDADVRQLREECRLDANTYLGVNTVLPEGDFEVEQSALGQQTRLGPTPDGRPEPAAATATRSEPLTDGAGVEEVDDASPFRRP
jgi:phage tail-like protein